MRNDILGKCQNGTIQDSIYIRGPHLRPGLRGFCSQADWLVPNTANSFHQFQVFVRSYAKKLHNFKKEQNELWQQIEAFNEQK